MAENDQHLKHGKALCGKVFGRFVETFNALVDFMLGLKGDAQGKNGEGHITYDRKNNIIRCDGCGGKGGSGSGVTANEKSGLKVEDDEIDISGREEDDAFGIRTMTVKGEDETEDKTVMFLGTENVEIPAGGTGGVTSLNSETGDMHVIGGKGIEVTTDGKTIKITANEEKQEEDPDPSIPEPDPCAHPGDKDNGGGVSPDDDEPGGTSGGSASGGGVNPGEGETHPGDDGCNCD